MPIIIFQLFLVLFQSSAWAALPAAESLFRNGSNPEITQNTVILDFVVKKLQIDLNEQKSIEEITDSEIRRNLKLSQQDFKQYVKMYFFNQGQDKINFIQLRSKRPISEKNTQQQLYSRKGFLRLLKYKKTLFPEKDLFYATLFSLAMNEGSLFSSILRRTDHLFKTNKQVLNREKIQLLKKYKKYLAVIKKDPSIAKHTPSPLKPSNESERERINKILKSSMYVPSERISLLKDQDDFFIRLKLENYLFNFSNEEHYFLDYKYENETENISMKFYQYILYNGTHQLPSKIVYKLSDGSIYLIAFNKLRHVNTSKSFYAKKTKKMQKLIQSSEGIERLPFLY